MSEEAQRLAVLHVAMLAKIADAQRKGEVTKERATALAAWWEEFMEAFTLPEAERARRMREVIGRGTKQFTDVPIMKELFTSLGIKPASKRVACKACGGLGWIKCDKCGGVGRLYGQTPRGYVGMPISSICDRCYGRGRDRECWECSGTGWVLSSRYE